MGGWEADTKKMRAVSRMPGGKRVKIKTVKNTRKRKKIKRGGKKKKRRGNKIKRNEKKIKRREKR